MISAVKDLGMETCVTLGMLTSTQAARLSDAGLDFYNHNVDTSPEFYGSIVTTRTLQDRIETLAMCARPASKSAVVAVSEWVRGSMTGLPCSFCSPIFPGNRKACPLACGTR